MIADVILSPTAYFNGAVTQALLHAPRARGFCCGCSGCLQYRLLDHLTALDHKCAPRQHGGSLEVGFGDEHGDALLPVLEILDSFCQSPRQCGRYPLKGLVEKKQLSAIHA